MKILRRYILMIATSLTLFQVIRDKTMNINYEFVDEETFAEYSDGLIYIGDLDYIEEVKKFCKDDDILVLDRRYGNDPDIKICNSYKITNKSKQLEILKTICEYENKYPSDWNRTISSMQLEWNIHNVLYYLDYKRYHTTDVDFNNNDEKIYKIKY